MKISILIKFSLIGICLYMFTTKALAQSPKSAYDKAVFLYPKRLKINSFDLTTDEKKTLQDFINNPFDTSINVDTLDVSLNKLSSSSGTGEEGLFSSISISPATQSLITDAIAKAIADQFQESVTTIYLNKFREKLKEQQAYQNIFPKTYGLLERGNFFRFEATGKEFITDFQEDLQKLPSNLLTYCNDSLKIRRKLPKPFNVLFAKNKDSLSYYRPLRFAIDASDKLVDGYHPDKLLDYLEMEYDPKNEPDFNSYYTIVKLINILQKSLQKNQSGFGNNLWINFDELKKLNTPEKIAFYLGFIFQENRIFFTSNDSFSFKGDMIKMAKTDPATFLQKKVFPILVLLSKTDNYLVKEKLTVDDYGEIMRLTFDLIKTVNDFLPESDEKNKLGKIDSDAISICQLVIDMHRTIVKKDYSLVIPNLVTILDILKKPEDTELVKFRNILIKYGPFVTGAASAKNSDELKVVIKKAILPSGSYEAKRNSLVSLSISAHPGVVFGIEKLTAGKNIFQPNVGFTAPIGFDLVWGVQTDVVDKMDSLEKHRFVKDGKVRRLNGSYWGVMLQFADIGAVVNYRLNDATSELPDKITFAQVFSPGISIQHGFRKTPVTLGLGVQYTPQLRKVTVDNTEIASNAFRVQVRLTWDLPLLNIFTKTEK